MFETIRSYFKSLRFRIFLFLLLFGIVPSVAVRMVILHTYERNLVQERISSITSQMKLLSAQITKNDFINDTSSNSIQAELDQLAAIYDGRIILVNSSFEVVKDTYARDTGKIYISESINKAYRTQDKEVEIKNYDLQKKYIQVAIPIYQNGSKDVYGVMMITTSTDFLNTELANVKIWVFIVQAVAYVVLIVFGFYISGKMVQPMHRLAQSISDIQNGYDDTFHRVSDYEETEMISDAAKDMLERMQLVDQSRQEFVSNVSHELKTPLTSMKVLADSLNAQPDVPADLYREFMLDITEEIERENKIINDLLSLVRLDKSNVTLNITSVNINELLELLMKRLTPIAESKDISLVLESFRPVTAEIDEVKLTLALSNLVENAIKYNNPGGYVHVTLNADHQNFFVNVEDNGMGIPEDSQAHIFERFYRVDKSHSREIGGTGLGLAITRNAIIMHRGAIRLHSIEGEGTTFTVRIPLVYRTK